MKVATFTVRATMPQSVTWKRAADSEGFASCEAWLARAANAYLKLRAKAGLPLPWHLGRFPVRLEDGTEPEIRGWIARPFGHFSGTDTGPKSSGCHLHTLVYLPGRRIVATFRYARQCRSLAAELAGVGHEAAGRRETSGRGL